MIKKIKEVYGIVYYLFFVSPIIFAFTFGVGKCRFVTIFGFFFFSSRRRHTRSVSAFLLNRSSDLCLKVKNVLALALVVRSRCEVLKASVKALVFGMQVVNNFNCRGFGPLLEDKLCLIFKLAPSVCRMTFPILASLLVRLVVLLPFQLLRLSLATPSRWTPLALSVFLHCVVALLLTLL